MKHLIVFSLITWFALLMQGTEPTETVYSGTAPTISVPLIWTDGKVIDGTVPVTIDAHSLLEHSVTVSVDGLVVELTDGGGSFLWQPWTIGEHVLTHTVGSNVWNLTVSSSSATNELPANGFRGCTNLVSVTFPTGLTKVGAGAFTDCTHLARVHVPKLTDWFALSFADEEANPLTRDATLYVGGSPIELRGTSLEQLVVSEGGTHLSGGAFQDCTNLVSVTLPSSLTEIGAGVFTGCTGIRSVTLRGDVATLAELFPDAYESLTEVVIQSGTTELVDGFFDGCVALERIHLPSSSMGLGDNDFRTIGKLTAGKADGFWIQDGWVLGYLGVAPEVVEVPAGVKGIASYAFADQYDLVSVTFPNSLEYIGVNAFRRCTNLE